MSRRKPSRSRAHDSSRIAWDGLLDAPSTGAPRTIDDSRVDAVIAKTLESVPARATHWSTRTMAQTFNHSSDLLFVEKVRDIVGLYMVLDIHLVMDDYGTQKTPLHQELARPPSALPCAFHAELCVLAEPGRTLVRGADAALHSPRHASLDAKTRAGHQALP